MDNYVIGYNPISFVLCFLLDDLKIIDVAPEYNLYDYHLADLYLKPSVEVLELSDKLGLDCKVQNYRAYFGFNNKVSPIVPSNFQEIYNLYTRGKNFVEGEYKKHLDPFVNYFSINGKNPFDSYIFLIKKLEDYVLENDLFIKGSIGSIENEFLNLNENEKIPYNRLIYTENLEDLDLMLKGFSIKDFVFKHYYPEDKVGISLPLHDKYVYICENESQFDQDMTHLTYHISYTGKPYFKKTYHNNKIIYESTRQIFQKDIEGNAVLYSRKTKLMKDNLNLNKVCGIDLIGRLSQCYESLILKDVILRAKKLMEKYFDEEKGKKILLNN